MAPFKERSRKGTNHRMRQQESIRIHMSKLVMYGIFLAVVAVITPAKTTAKTPMGMSYANGQLGKKHLESRNNSNNYFNYFGFPQTPPPGYFGNWGFAPGGSHWEPNYKWRRSLGFWDTNSPACPFRYC
ncbi:MAG TPA: hypothetical protein VM822_20065 [Pseudolabrys sp.]|nr:hypothetical protein [Pseudolabrys sp.]